MSNENHADLASRRSDEIDHFVAKRIKARRRQLKLSQQDVAEQIGISYQQVQKYESGFNRVSAGKLFAIARILDVSVNYFFIGLEEVGLSPAGSKAASSIAQLSNEEVRNALTGLIDAIAESDTRKERLDT